MARESFGSLIKTTQDYISDDSTSSTTNLSDTKTFAKSEVNRTIRHMYSRLGIGQTQRQQTGATVVQQQSYHIPPDFYSLESFTVTVGTEVYQTRIVDSQDEWDRINQVSAVYSDVPEVVFVSRDEISIWPIPASADNTITINYNYSFKDLRVDDYDAGTVTTAQNSATVTGSGTTFTAAMVGRWFRATDDGDWYRISAFTSTTVITLETVFEAASVSGSAFTIGESPELPEEAQEYIPHRAAAIWYLGPGRNLEQSKAHMNYFLNGDPVDARKTGKAEGGFRAVLQRYASKGRGNSVIVNNYVPVSSGLDETWSTITE